MTRFRYRGCLNGRMVALALALALPVSLAQAQREEPVDLESLPWTGERLLTSLSSHTVSPTIVADEYGLHVIFQELRTVGNATVSYMSSPDLGKTWTLSQVLSSAYSMGVGTSLLSARGVLHAVWCPTERGINGLNYRRSRDGGRIWSNERVLTETTRAIYMPKLNEDGGTLYLIWIEKLIVGSDLATRAPTVQDLDIRTMTLKEDRTSGRTDESYDCTLNIMTSRDGGDSWTPKFVITRVFENIVGYNFLAEGPSLILNYQLGGGKYARAFSRDQGLVWQQQEISEQEFGAFEPPSVVKYKGNYFRIGTKSIDNRAVIFLARTDFNPPEAVILNSSREVFADEVLLQWTGKDDWSEADQMKFRYRFDDGRPSPWGEQSQLELGGLGDGEHELVVEAMDEAGNVCPVPATYRFEVKMPPETTILTQLQSVLADTSLKIEWTGSDNTTPPEQLHFLIAADGEPWREVGTDQSIVLSSLAGGEHHFAVKAVDEAGNVDPAPAEIRFFLDTQPPRTLSVEVGKWTAGVRRIPCRVTGQDNVTAPENLVFSVQVDDGSPGNFVRSPSLGIRNLSDGEHRLRVRARDEAGNVEEPPYEYTFSVDIPPQVEIISAPLPALAKADFEIVCRLWDNSTPAERILLSYRIGDEPWSVPLPGQVFRVRREDLERGQYRLQVKGVDEAGNESVPGPKSTYEFRVEPGQLPPPENLQVRPIPGGVSLAWQLSPEVKTQEGVRFNVYRAPDGGFGVTPEEREKYRVAQGLAGTTYDDLFPAEERGLVARYYYAVSMVVGVGGIPVIGLAMPPEAAMSLERESPLSRMVAVDLSPEGEAKQVGTAATVTSLPRRLLAVLVGVGVLAVLFVLIVIWLLMGRRRAARPAVLEEESKPFDEDEPWKRNEV